jgi:dTDP-4-amino-4,6-dideoxygalactose transaminase
MRATAYLKILLSPWRYNDPLPLKQLGQRLHLLYGDSPDQSWYLTANGRSALELFLRSLNSDSEGEVIVQSFTCVAAVNPILWAGLKPVFVDIDMANLSLSLKSLEAAISPRTKAIVVQHSFGIPGPIEAVTKLAHNKDILVIEDCAHALGLPMSGPKLGTYGDAAIISFGIEKTLSTKFGGALVVNNPELAPAIETAYEALPKLGRLESFRWLIYPVLRVGLRKLPVSLSRKTGRLLELLGILRQAVAPAEYEGGRPPGTPAKLPGVHARIILEAMTDLDQNLAHRTRIGQVYREALADNPALQLPPTEAEGLIKYPVICASEELRDRLYKGLLDKGVPVSNWYDPPIYPQGVDLERLGYRSPNYPEAEATAKRIICLPTGNNIRVDYATVMANDLSTAATDLQGRTKRVSRSS